MRTCSPTASVTGRPEACTSWAIWIPLADGPDHQHPALREVGGAAVGGQVRCGPARRPLLDPRGHAVAERGHGGDARPARGDDDRARPPRLLVGLDDVPVVGAAHGGDRRVRLDGRRGLLRVALDERGDLRSGHVAVRVVAAVGVAGQPAHPVGREQAERVPALRTPRARHLAAFEHDVVDAALGEVAAHGQPAVARTDDDGGHPQHGTPPPGRCQLTSTVTATGLVRLS